MTEKSAELVCDGNGYDPCGEPVVYVRHTQFAGSHPFCILHAMAERDILQDDSYQYWEKLGTEDDADPANKMRPEDRSK